MATDGSTVLNYLPPLPVKTWLHPGPWARGDSSSYNVRHTHWPLFAFRYDPRDPLAGPSQLSWPPICLPSVIKKIHASKTADDQPARTGPGIVTLLTPSHYTKIDTASHWVLRI